MATETKTLDDLGSLKPGGAQADAPVHVQKLDKFRPRLCHRQAQGRRRARLDQARRGQITVNTKDYKAYFARPAAADAAPAAAQCREPRLAVRHHRDGGRWRSLGSAGAVRHGISKALTYYEPELRGVLKKGGSSPATAVRSSVSIWPHEGPPQLPVLEALTGTFRDTSWFIL